jgi:hypothetical protein
LGAENTLQHHRTYHHQQQRPQDTGGVAEHELPIMTPMMMVVIMIADIASPRLTRLIAKTPDKRTRP